MTQFSAGRYYVGDLRYVMHVEWDEVRNKFLESCDSICTLNDGRSFWFSNTACGDGIFEDLTKKRYPVDAGIIGIIATSDITKNYLNNLNLGKVYEFKEPFDVSCTGGVFTFGDVVIDSNFDTSNK